MAVQPLDSSQITSLHVPKSSKENKRIAKNYALSYDDMLRLFDAIESGELENRCTPQDLEKVAHFLAVLAKKGDLQDLSQESLSLNVDIEALLNGGNYSYETTISFSSLGGHQYSLTPAVFYGKSKAVHCKNWIKKRWKNLKRFAHKHKKALIIGAAIVVAAAVVITIVVASSSAASAAAAGAAGAAGAASDNPHGSKDKGQNKSSLPPVVVDTQSSIDETLQPTLDEQITSFKENLVQNQLLPSTNLGEEGLSLEENGRTLGSLFAHDTLNQLQQHPNFSSQFTSGTENNHPEIDHQFSTDYTTFYTDLEQPMDFTTLSYQAKGEKALAYGYYNEAVFDLGKAIELNPTHPNSYLERGIANFNLGKYDTSLKDFQQFVSLRPPEADTLSYSEFGLGFAKGLPKGVYDSGEGLMFFLADFVQHPIHTTGQVFDSVSTLVGLVHQDEWGVVSEALVPEIHQLVTQWDTLPSHERGELAGYAVGKLGSDVLVPGALVKVASKSTKGAQQLATACKNLQIAQETLLLETAAGIGNSAKIGELIKTGQTTTHLAEELGFLPKEMGQLKQTGVLESAVAKRYDHLSLSMQESLALHKKAQEVLKPYAKKNMPEIRVRELIHETGFPTFSKPKGVPENYLVRITEKGAGMEYVHPTNTHLSVRVMPGKPHSPYLHQQKPYVIQMKDGKAFDKHGHLVLHESPEAHIPVNEFIYRG